MKINGLVEVDKWLYNTAVKTFDTLNELETTNTRIGSIGMFSNILYYRINNTTVIPIVSSLYLENVLNNINFGDEIINNIVNDITNNEEFITTIIDNILNTIINDILNNTEFLSSIINGVLSTLNVEVRSLKNKTLFFAFDPSTINEIQPIVTLPPSSNTCNTPTSVTLIGDFKPIKGSTSNYDIEVVGSNDYLITYTVKGGVILTSPHETPVQVSWNTINRGLASISVGVGCSDDIVNTKYDFKFFTLADEISPPLTYFTIPLAYGLDLVSSVDAFNLNQITDYFSAFNSLQYSNFLYITNELLTVVIDGYYTNVNYIYRLVNGQIIEIRENNV